jgi:putative ABC transport system permease protein
MVVVVGADIVEHLMAGVDPIGREIRLDGWTYQVIGVGKKKGKTLGQSLDNYVMIPITTYLKQYGAHNDSVRISGKATSAGPELSEAIDETRVALRSHRHDRLGANDSFDIETNESLLGIWSNFSNTFFMATIGVACIALVVGGIVIMNIMLVAVTERTREIGVRKAIGARRLDIIIQFLTEAVVLAIFGGILGITTGVVSSKIISDFLGWPTLVSTPAIAMAFSFAGAIGVGAGWYPARKASRLDPIDALRYE